MLDFKFISPTQFIFGRNAEEALVKESSKLGGKILLHYGGGSIKRSGLYDRVKKYLADAGTEVVELGGVKPNPVLSMVREGIDLCRAEGITGILAVGGGSVIDSAKAIAIGVPYDSDVWDFYTEKATVAETLPVGVILTIPAAGSEGSNGSVVTDEDTRSKFVCGSDLMRPLFSLMNPELTFTLSPYQTACGIADMISHVMERYFTNTEDVGLTDRLGEALIRTVIDAAPKVLADPEDYEARAELMWAGTIAHTDIVGLGRETDWASHQIEHELSAQYDVAHGAGLAVVFPAWMTHVRKENLSRFVQFAVRVWDVDYVAGREDETALEGIRRHKAFYDSIGMPTSLSALGITDNRYDIMADKAMRDGPFGGLKKLGKEDVVAIYTLAESN